MEALASLAHSPNVAIIVTDRSGLTTWANDAALRLTGYTLPELLGRSPGSVLQCDKTDPGARERMRQAISRQQPCATELLNRHKDGTLYWTRLQVLPWADAQGQHQGFVSFQVDSTLERLTLESALASRQHMLSQFTHELRTPLNAIIQLNDLLAASQLTPEQAEICHQSHEAAQGLLSLVNDVLTRAERDHHAVKEVPRATQVSELVARVCRLFESKGIRDSVVLTCTAPTGLPAFALQDSRLYRVLLNLVSNALKFTPQGRVELSVEARHVVRTGPAWDLRFCVSDTGIGMDEWQVEQLMRPFARVHDPEGLNPPGSGLGLLLSDEAIRAMGATLQIHSTPGVGSQFWFTLAVEPASTPNGDGPTLAGSAPHLQPPLPTTLAGLHILLVDDNPVGLSACARQLRRLGARVSEARDGEQALQLAASLGVQVLDLVLMDVQMPGIDGLEATRRLLAMPGFEQMPVLGLTAGFIGQSDAAYRSAGMCGVVTKPFALEALARAVMEAVA